MFQSPFNVHSMSHSCDSKFHIVIFCQGWFRLSSQSATSYLFHIAIGFWQKGLGGSRECMGTPEGDGDRLRALALRITNRTSLGSWGMLRLEDLRMVGGVCVGVESGEGLGELMP
eukprot:g36639.t1